MSDPISVVIKTANTPEQAKIYIGMLAAEGIPAFTDGAPPDEFSMSQRMMNLSSVKVMVPASAAERAKEILQPTEIDMDELTRQALAASDSPDANGGDPGVDTDS